MDTQDIHKFRAAQRVRKQREMAYPKMQDYLDGVAKASSVDPAIKAAGEAQISAYCQACLAVKLKYPKHEVAP